MSRYRDTQLQANENDSYLNNLTPNLGVANLDILNVDFIPLAIPVIESVNEMG